MNVNLSSLIAALKRLEEHHQVELRGKSGRSLDFEEGFVKGLMYVREFVVPAFETVEVDEASAVEESCRDEIADLRLRHRLGIPDETGTK